MPSHEMVTIRTAFLKTAMGMMHSVKQAFFQIPRRRKCCASRPAMNSVNPEWMPLHCSATSISTPGKASWLGVLLLAAAMAQAAQGGGRLLTTSDVVAIRIPDHPDLDWTARIEPDGTINFPYVGRIKAAGLTEDDLARTVERRLVELKIIAEP